MQLVITLSIRYQFDQEINSPQLIQTLVHFGFHKGKEFPAANANTMGTNHMFSYFTVVTTIFFWLKGGP